MSVHNGVPHLEDSIESILGQEGVEIEFLIVDDGSVDETPEILARFEERDPRVRILRQSNRGLTLSLIRGCQEARANLIARQDADDLSKAGRLEALRNAITSEENAVMASSWGGTIGPRGEHLSVIQRPSDPHEATRALIHERLGPPGHGSVMFRKDAYERVGGYRSQFYYGQDSDLWLRLAQVGLVIYVPRVLYESRYRMAGISIQHRSAQRAFGRICRRCLDARMAGQSEEIPLQEAEAITRGIRDGLASADRADQRRAVADGLYMVGACLEQADPSGANVYFKRAVLANPRHLRAWVRWLRSGARCLLGSRVPPPEPGSEE